MPSATSTTTAASTSQAILAAAREAVLADGFAALSTRRVAERAGVPLSQIHYHFGSKHNLVLELVASENARLVKRQAAMYAGDEPLSLQWDRACDYLDDDLNSGYVQILQELIAAGYSNLEVASRLRAMLDDWIAIITGAFAHHMDRGLNLGPATPAQLAALAGAAFLGAEQFILLGQESSTTPIREGLRSIGTLIAMAESAAPVHASTPETTS